MVVDEAKRRHSFFLLLIGHRGVVYLHDNEKVEDQDERGQEGSGDLIAGKEASV